MPNGAEQSLPLELDEHQDVVVGQKVGYARASSLEQNLDRQLAQLRAAGASQIYKEKISGSTRHRPQLEEVLRYLRKGDQLIVTSMDRLTRSLVDLHTIFEDLVGRGVSVRFLREGQTYSAKADPIAKLILGLMGSVAEFERSIIKERQAEGIARAKARGVYTGRVKVLTDVQIAQARGRGAGGVPKADFVGNLPFLHEEGGVGGQVESAGGLGRAIAEDVVGGQASDSLRQAWHDAVGQFEGAAAGFLDEGPVVIRQSPADGVLDLGKSGLVGGVSGFGEHVGVNSHISAP